MEDISPALRYCHLAGTETELSKAIPPFCQASCFKLMEKYGKTSEIHEHRPTCCKPFAGVQASHSSNAVWNKAFCKSTDGSFGRSTACRENKPLSRVCVYSRKNKMLPFPM